MEEKEEKEEEDEEEDTDDLNTVHDLTISSLSVLILYSVCQSYR